MANINDKITDVRNAARPNSTTVSSPRSVGGTTLACANLTGWPTASKIHFVTYQIDSNSNPIAGTQLDCYGIVSGNNIGSFTVVDGTDAGNAVGDKVEMLPTAGWGQDLADALTTEHNRTGTHKNITTDTITVSSGSTLPAGDIGTADLAASAVTTAKINNAAVTADKLSTGAQRNFVSTSETTTSTSFVDLATVQNVTVTVGANGLLLCGYGAQISNNGANGTYISVALSSANTSAASINDAAISVQISPVRIGVTRLFTGLTPGSTIVTAKFQADAGTGTFSRRELWAIPL